MWEGQSLGLRTGHVQQSLGERETGAVGEQGEGGERWGHDSSHLILRRLQVVGPPISLGIRAVCLREGGWGKELTEVREVGWSWKKRGGE